MSDRRQIVLDGDDRLFLREGTDEVSSDDEVELWVYNGACHMEISNPWAGDSETGFGRETNINLNREACVALITFLQKNLPSIK